MTKEKGRKVMGGVKNPLCHYVGETLKDIRKDRERRSSTKSIRINMHGKECAVGTFRALKINVLVKESTEIPRRDVAAL